MSLLVVHFCALPALWMCFSSIHWSVWKGLSNRVRKQNVWHFQTQDHYKHLSESETSYTFTVTLWICVTDQNQTEWGEKALIFANCRVIQVAKADFVINGVYCLNTTQNVSYLPWWLWCHLEQIYCRNSSDFFYFFWQLKLHNKLLSC